MKRISIMLLILFFYIGMGFAQKAKYVFYFIGDGMGVNQVNCTEMYLAELDSCIGIKPLLFTQFPFYTVATTFSKDSGVTDSAASGTALASGHKTKNGVIGMLGDLKTPVSSIATWAKKQGAKVGVCTTVSINHATPASFYAHQPDRHLYYEIGTELSQSNFDFFGGSAFLSPKGKKNNKTDLNELAEKAGYTIYHGYNEYEKGKTKEKVILFQPEGKDIASLPYAIDCKADDLSLQEIVKAGIDVLSCDSTKGFFFMVEGGKIDYACHSNDAATAVNEVINFDNAIKEAYKFYEQHPDETLIVVTADHETGGLSLGRGGKYILNLKALAAQKMSEVGFTTTVNKMRKETKNHVTWEMMQQSLKENFGFWNTITLSEDQQARLKKVYNDSFGHKDVALKESEYQKAEPIVAVAQEILSEIARVGWTSDAHTASYVPVMAIGVGAERFCKRTDNAEIPLTIANIAGYIAE